MAYLEVEDRALLARQAIIVLGMHRSGTSATSGMLAKLGAQEPKTIMPPSVDNPFGYWESVEFMGLHDGILESSGSNWSDWGKFNQDWFESNAAAEHRLRLSALLRAEYGDAGLLLLKDPRVCRFLPFWLKELKEREIVPKVVFPLRNPLEVARSLQARDHFGRVRALLLWLRHVLDAEKDSRTVDRCFLRYQDLLKDWRHQARHISKTLNVKWPKWSASVELEIDAYLSSELRRHVVTDSAMVDGAGLSDWVSETASALDRLVGDPHDAKATGTLDRVREEFDRTSAIYAAAVQEHVRELEEKTAGLNRMSEERERALSKVAQMEEQRARDEQELVAAKNRIAEQDSVVDTLSAKLAERDGFIGKLSAQIAARDEELEKKVAELQRACAKAETREATLVALQLKLRAMKNESAEHQRLSKVRFNELAALSRRLLQVEKEADQARQEHARAIGIKLMELARLEKQLSVVLQSGSWRLTAPLRGMSSLLRRMFEQPEDAAHVLRSSGLFDEAWYLEKNPDVRASGIDPAEHYLKFGASENRDPSPDFSTAEYRARFSEMPGASAVNPLLQHIRDNAAATKSLKKDGRQE